MIRVRTIRTDALVMLALGAGLIIGLLAGRIWGREIDRRWARAQYAFTQRMDRTVRDTVQVREDSILFEKNRRSVANIPREVRRLQAYGDCAVTFWMRDPELASLQVFRVRGQGKSGAVLSEGVRYEDGGYPENSLVTVVLPNVECGRIDFFGTGFSAMYLGPDSLAGPRFIPLAPAAPGEPVQTGNNGSDKRP
ncbi:MAG: hypothetical protein M3497_05710 [Gemmatimonadota bacterium]|jgi:hypothetical protein|nr:hypothetical protein [Gemmatimonadota bacterium]